MIPSSVITQKSWLRAWNCLTSQPQAETFKAGGLENELEKTLKNVVLNQEIYILNTSN